MAGRISFAWFASVAIVLMLAFLTKTSQQYSREVIIIWALAVFALQIPLLKLNYFAVSIYRKKHTKPINSIVVGLGKTARFFSKKLNDNHWLPDKIVGMVNGYGLDVPADISRQLSFPLLGELQNIKQIITLNKVQRVYVSLPLKTCCKS